MKIIFFLTTFLWLILITFSCGNGQDQRDYYDTKEFNDLLNTSEYKVLNTIHYNNSNVFKIYQDEGALGGHSFYLFHKKGSSKYHRIIYIDTIHNIAEFENKYD